MYCSKTCVGESQKSKRGPAHQCWKGGRLHKKSGYILIWNPDHPNADRFGYVAEHRLVMSEVLGRPLKDDEHVHHKNRDRSDNRPENLEILNPSEHAKHHSPETSNFSYPRGWLRFGHGCVRCGTTDSPHFGRKHCYECYKAMKRDERRAKV